MTPRRSPLWHEGILPLPRAARLDWSHPATRGLEFYVVGSDPIDLVTGELGATITASGLTPTRDASPVGLAMGFHGNSSAAQVSGYKFAAAPKRTTWSGFGAATVLSVFIIDALANIDQSIFVAGNGSSAGIAVYAAASTGVLNINTPGNWGAVSTTLSVSQGVPYAIACCWPVASGDTVVAVRNLATGTVQTATLTGKWGMANSNAASYEIGSSTKTSMNGRMALGAFSTRKMPLTELVQWTATPYIGLRPAIARRIFVPSTSGISGTLSQTLDALTATATGTLAIGGTATPSLDALTNTAVGTLAITGVGAASLEDLTATATGSHGRLGTAAVTLGDVTSMATGALGIAGTASVALVDLALAGAGAVALHGALSKTLGALTLSAFEHAPSEAGYTRRRQTRRTPTRSWT